MNPSPLRYPGGKYKLYPYVAKLIEINVLRWRMSAVPPNRFQKVLYI